MYKMTSRVFIHRTEQNFTPSSENQLEITSLISKVDALITGGSKLLYLYDEPL